MIPGIFYLIYFGYQIIPPVFVIIRINPILSQVMSNLMVIPKYYNSTPNKT